MSCAVEMTEKEIKNVEKLTQTMWLLGKEISYKKYQKKVSKKPSVIGPVIQNFTILLLIVMVAVIATLVMAE